MALICTSTLSEVNVHHTTQVVSMLTTHCTAAHRQQTEQTCLSCQQCLEGLEGYASSLACHIPRQQWTLALLTSNGLSRHLSMCYVRSARIGQQHMEGLQNGSNIVKVSLPDTYEPLLCDKVCTT